MAAAVLIVVALVVAGWFLTRSGELFFVSVRDGRALLVRGRIPPGLLTHIRDIVKEPPVARASIFVHRTPEGARLTTRGIDPGRTQRLRNTLGIYPMSQLRSAPVDAERSFGQIAGLAWLAWLMTRR